HLREQMQATAGDRARRQRDVERALQIRGGRGIGELAEPARRQVFDRLLDLVDGGADERPVRRWEPAELLHHLRHLPLLAEELRLRGADRLLVGERADQPLELVAESLEVRDQVGCGGHRPTYAATIALNATGSLIAISASIFRFSCTFAVPSLPSSL